MKSLFLPAAAAFLFSSSASAIQISFDSPNDDLVRTVASDNIAIDSNFNSRTDYTNEHDWLNAPLETASRSTAQNSGASAATFSFLNNPNGAIFEFSQFNLSITGTGLASIQAYLDITLGEDTTFSLSGSSTTNIDTIAVSEEISHQLSATLDPIGNELDSSAFSSSANGTSQTFTIGEDLGSITSGNVAAGSYRISFFSRLTGTGSADSSGWLRLEFGNPSQVPDSSNSFALLGIAASAILLIRRRVRRK